MKIIIILWTLFFVCFPTSAQVVERPYPEEWKQLVPGARFVDRFLPMPDGRQETGIWGADSVLCRYVDNGIELPDVSFWGGNILRSSDGKYHLYVCGWAEDSPNGHGTWWDSTVFHAECDNSTGPFKIRNSIGRGFMRNVIIQRGRLRYGTPLEEDIIPRLSVWMTEGL